MSIFDAYNVKLTLVRDQLATNSADPDIHNTHVIEKQRKIIQDKSSVNTAINKYLGQVDISAEKGEEEVNRLIDRLEANAGVKFTPEQRTLALEGKMDDLRETFQEFDTKGTTIFFHDKATGRPCIGDHMIYGYLKAAAEAIGRTLPKKQGTIMQSTAFTQSIINQHLKISQQFIVASEDVKRRDDGKPEHNVRSLRAVTAQGPRVTLAKSEVLPAGTVFEFTVKILKNSPLTKEILAQLLEYGEHFVGLGQWRNAGFGQFTFELSEVGAKAAVTMKEEPTFLESNNRGGAVMDSLPVGVQ